VNKKLAFSLKTQGFLQALGVVIYCSLVGLLMWKGNTIFGKAPNYFGPVAVLLLFSVSALICAVIVFYQPYKLFFDREKKNAVNLVLFTTGFLVLFLLVFLLLAALIR
jgi:hypothetical protein